MQTSTVKVRHASYMLALVSAATLTLCTSEADCNGRTTALQAALQLKQTLGYCYTAMQCDALMFSMPETPHTQQHGGCSV